MSGSDSINRRQFLERTSLLGAAATAAVGARKTSAQINNAAGLNVEPVRLGFIGVGIRGTLLMEAAAGIAGVEVKVVADCYRRPPRRRPGADLAGPGDHRRLRGDPLPSRHRRGGRRHPGPLAPEDDPGGPRRGEARLHREAHDPPLGGRGGVHRRRGDQRQGRPGGQPVHEHGLRAEGDRSHPDRAPRAGHARRGSLPPQHRHRSLVLPDPSRRLAADRGLRALPGPGPDPGLRPSALLPVAALLGLLRRAPDGPLRPSRDRHPPAHGGAGARERLRVRRRSTTGRTTARCRTR